MTHPFNTTSGDYFKIILLIWSVRYGWMLLIPLMVMTIIGITSDVRWLIVALCVLFIIMPMVMAMVYFYYLLTPEARRSVTPKRVEITPSKHIYIEYVTISDENEVTVTDTETISADRILSVYKIGRFTVYLLKSDKISVLLIPNSTHPL